MIGHSEADSASTVAEQNEKHLPPEETLAADERPTPMWLPLIGLSLALGAVLVLVSTGPSDADEKKPAESAASKSAKPAVSAEAPPTPRAAGRRLPRRGKRGERVAPDQGDHQQPPKRPPRRRPPPAP